MQRFLSSHTNLNKAFYKINQLPINIAFKVNARTRIWIYQIYIEYSTMNESVVVIFHPLLHLARLELWMFLYSFKLLTGFDISRAV